MKNAFKLFWTDLKKIGNNPLALVVLIALTILPSLYAWFNLQALWDPYGNTQNIKIAVVNEDKGDTVKGKKINVGDNIVDTLKDNKDFDWKFVSKAKADHDVKFGKNYASLYIPKDFSHKMTSTLRKKPQKANITYKINEKLNAIAPKMTDAGTSAVVDKANKKFEQTVTKALVKEANKAGLKIEDEIPTINKIQDGVNKAYDSLPKINKFADLLIYLDKNPEEIDQYADKFRGLAQYKGDITNGVQKLNDLNAKIPEINEKAKLVLLLESNLPNIKEGLNKADNVQNKFPQINQGVATASNGIAKAQQGLNEGANRLKTLEARVGQYQQGVNRAQQFSQGVQNNLQTSQQSTNQSSTLSDSDVKVEQLSANDSKVQPKNGEVMTSEDANEMENILANSLLSLSNNVGEQSKASQTNLETLKPIVYGIVSSDNPEDFKEPLENVNLRLENSTKYNQQFIDILSDLEDKEDVDLSSEINKIETVNNRLNSVVKSNNQLLNSLSNGDVSQREAMDVLQKLPKLDNNLSDLRQFIKQDLNQTLSTISSNVASTLDNADTKLSTVQSKLNTVNQIIDSGHSILNSGKERIDTIQNVLPEIEKTYSRAIATAQANFSKFQSDVEDAAHFVRNDLPRIEQNLTDATNSVNENVPLLFNQYNQLLNSLNENQPKAKEELHRLADFSENKLPGLEKDLTKAKKTFDDLDKNDSVDKLVDFLKNDLAKNADTIAHPVNYNKKAIYPIKDYGSGNVPFYTSLALWVGTLLQISMMTTENKQPNLRTSVRETFVGKSLLFITMSLIQSVIVSTGDLIFLHAQASSALLFIGTCMFIGIVFICITYTLVSLLGNPGKALAIVLLVLQIAGGGGTFPVEVLPEFWQTLHQFLPFSYAIDLLREVVAGPIPEIYVKKMIILGLIGLGVYIFGLIFKKPLDPYVKQSTKKGEESNVLE